MSDLELVVASEPKKLTASEKKFNKNKMVVMAAICAATESFYKKNSYATSTDKQDDVALKVGAALHYFASQSSGTYAAALVPAFAAIIGKPIVVAARPLKSIIWVRLAAIIPETTTSHNYPIGKIAIITQDQKGIREDGTFGNTLDNNASFYRPATSEEIEKMSNETYAALIREFVIAS